MKNFVLIGLIFLLTSCANKIKTINGDWQQIFLGYEGENNIGGYVTDSAIIHLNLSKNQI